MFQQEVHSSQKPVVRASMKHDFVSQFDSSHAPGSTSRRSSFHICSQLKSNTVIALSSLASEGEGKFYGVRCLIAGVWSLQMQAGLQPYDPAVQLVVVNRNGILGLRSAIAEGRLLGCDRHYHLTFEHWQMESQEAWSLEGSSLLDCTLRNEMHKLTLNIRVTVLAEPTDILGNIRITSALITTSFSRLDPSATSKPSSASSSHVKGRLVQKGERDSCESPRLFLVRPGSNTKCSNPFTHKRDKSSSQEIKTISSMLSKTGGQGKALQSSSHILHESSGTSSPTCGMYTFSSFVKSDSPQDTPFRTQSFTEEARPDSHILCRKGSATNWKRTIPSGEDEVQHSSLPGKTRVVEPESHSDAISQEPTRNHAVETGVHPSNPSPPGNARKVRKWKRNSEGNQKVCNVDLYGDNRPNLELKISPVSMEVYDADEEGTLLSPGRINKSSSPRDGGHSPQVVIKRQTRYLATKVDSDLSPTTPHNDMKDNVSESSGEKLKYSKSQLDAALNNLRKDAARQEKDKVVHWKLQAAVRLLKSETQQKLALIAKAALEELNARTIPKDANKSNWFSYDELPQKRAISWKRSLKPTANTNTFHHNKRPWTYSLRHGAVTKEEEVSLAVSSMGRNSSSSLQMLLKFWFFLPVPLLALACVTIIYRRKKAKV
ncbi:hypothetical protein Mapa_011037 [Marchantia paleacea]|nr:hypothetical protein Mapa_011037 [Marchantia paleacea]